jgi:cysteine desulfurase
MVTCEVRLRAVAFAGRNGDARLFSPSNLRNNVGMESIYLDHNATTPTHPEVIEAMARAAAAGYANPASQHRPGQAARKVLEDARQRMAELLGAKLSGADADRLVFTAGATEANNLALLGIAQARREAPGQLIISSIEHQSVIEPAEHLLERGWRLDTLPVSPDGVVSVDALRQMLRPESAVASVTMGNHDTGVLQPIADLAAVSKAAGVPLHTDAAQVAGKRAIEFRRLGVSALSLGAHKFGGPVGIGALVLAAGVPIRPLLFGGHQQGGLRPSTESIPLALGMLTALEIRHRNQLADAQRVTALRERFENGLVTAIPGAVIHGQQAERLPQTTSAALPGIDGQIMLVALSMSGVACSVGSACSSGSSELSPTLQAMGLPREMAGRSLRFSLGTTTTEAEIDEALRRIVYVWGEVRG